MNKSKNEVLFENQVAKSVKLSKKELEELLADENAPALEHLAAVTIISALKDPTSNLFYLLFK